MTITQDAMQAVPLGDRLAEGVVSWSGNTGDKTRPAPIGAASGLVAVMYTGRHA
jgi:hypothetical protein